jgi:hypothetical protein
MKVIELIGVVIIVMILVSFIVIEDQMNGARVKELSSSFEDKFTLLYNQSVTNITNLATSFQSTLDLRLTELNTKNTEIANLNSQISAANSDKTATQAKYDLLNGTITTRINNAVLHENNDWKNFTRAVSKAVFNIGNAVLKLKPASENFTLAKNKFVLNTTSDYTAAIPLANKSKTNYTNAKTFFVGSDDSFATVVPLITQPQVLNYSSLYRSYLSTSIAMTEEALQTIYYLTNASECFIHLNLTSWNISRGLMFSHWKAYNISYNLYLNKTAEVDTYIRNW